MTSGSRQGSSLKIASEINAPSGLAAFPGHFLASRWKYGNRDANGRMERKAIHFSFYPDNSDNPDGSRSALRISASGLSDQMLQTLTPPPNDGRCEGGSPTSTPNGLAQRRAPQCLGSSDPPPLMGGHCASVMLHQPQNKKGIRMSAFDELERISIREFARRDRCDEKLVRRAVTRGFLPKSEDKLLPAFLVGSGWRETNRRTADTRQKLAAECQVQVSAPVRESAPPRLDQDGPRECGLADGLLILAGHVPSLLREAAEASGVPLDAVLAIEAALRSLLLTEMASILDQERVDPVVLAADDQIEAVRAGDTWSGYQWPADTLEPVDAD